MNPLEVSAMICFAMAAIGLTCWAIEGLIYVIRCAVRKSTP